MYVVSLQHLDPHARPNLSRPPNTPLHIRNTNLLPGLLVIVKPLPIRKFNTSKLRPRLYTCSQKFALSLELSKLQPPAVKLEDVDGLWWVGLLVALRRSFDVR
jgi:hypothetical protein